MCYAKPGPRCSAHARQRLEKAVRSRKTLGYINTDISNEVEVAYEEFNSTPAGQKLILEEINKTNEFVKDVQNGVYDKDYGFDREENLKFSEDTLTGLKLSLQNGRSLRKSQLMAWKELQKQRKEEGRELDSNKVGKETPGASDKRQCRSCGEWFPSGKSVSYDEGKNFVEWGADPYSAEIGGIYTPSWSCVECSYESAMDI